MLIVFEVRSDIKSRVVALFQEGERNHGTMIRNSQIFSYQLKFEVICYYVIYSSSNLFLNFFYSTRFYSILFYFILCIAFCISPYNIGNNPPPQATPPQSAYYDIQWFIERSMQTLIYIRIFQVLLFIQRQYQKFRENRAYFSKCNHVKVK